jgi:hypothetical protein
VGRKTKTQKFLKKWDAEFQKGLAPLVEDIREAGFTVDGPYPIEGDESPIWVMDVWKGGVRPNTDLERNWDAVVDIMFRLDPIHDDLPLRYWPAVDLTTSGGSQIGSTNFWDAPVDLRDDRTLRQIVENLDAEANWIIEMLDEHDWPAGPKDWTPKKSLGATKEWSPRYTKVVVLVDDMEKTEGGPLFAATTYWWPGKHGNVEEFWGSPDRDDHHISRTAQYPSPTDALAAGLAQARGKGYEILVGQSLY